MNLFRVLVEYDLDLEKIIVIFVDFVVLEKNVEILFLQLLTSKEEF